MEVVANVIETCDKEAGQKILLQGSHVHKDILRLGENAGRDAKSPE